MSWSNKPDQNVITAVKGHSLSFRVRVEDRMHVNILSASDKCYFTVRPVSYKLGFNDTDIVAGTASVQGNGIMAVGTYVAAGPVFEFKLQASQLNLDPEQEYFYDLTYSRDGYSISIDGGIFDVTPSTTNRAVQDTYSSTSSIFDVITQVDGQSVITVSSTIPLPQKGDYGSGAYTVNFALSETVGDTSTVPVSTIIVPSGRSPQAGDILFSTVTKGVLATIQSVSWIGTPSAVILTRQNYSMQPLKALLDIVHKTTPTGGGSNLETIDYSWQLPKTHVPLPFGYEYRVGDFVFSHTALAAMQANKKLIISLVTAIGTTDLTVQTKVCFPIFLDDADIAGLLDSKANSALTVNGKPLTSNVTLTEDDIPAGTANAKVTPAQITKLGALPTAAQYAADLSGKATYSHGHQIGDVANLQSTLDLKVESTTLDYLWVGNQAAYDAIGTKDARTVYFIKN